MKRETYITIHNAIVNDLNLEVGDKVTITRIPTAKEFGWAHGPWHTMNSLTNGQLCEVKNLNLNTSFGVEIKFIDPVGKQDGCFVPATVIGTVVKKAKPTEVKINDRYTAKIDENGTVVVGARYKCNSFTSFQDAILVVTRIYNTARKIYEYALVIVEAPKNPKHVGHTWTHPTSDINHIFGVSKTKFTKL